MTSPFKDFDAQATRFLATAVHPTFEQPYTSLTCVPMVELLGFVDANGFTCYMVAGGGREFMRPVAQSIYGLAPERIIDNASGLTFNADDGGVTIIRAAALGIIDDGPEKAVQVWEKIGRRPILAAGNANRDVLMLQFAADQERPTLCMLVHHDDAKREVKYNAGAENAIETAGDRRLDGHQHEERLKTSLLLPMNTIRQHRVRPQRALHAAHKRKVVGDFGDRTAEVLLTSDKSFSVLTSGRASSLSLPSDLRPL